MRAGPAALHDPRRGGGLVGFANTFFDYDPTWGALLDNLHVAEGHQRRGIGARLLALTRRRPARVPAADRAPPLGAGQNRAAQGFYEASGGECVERSPVPAPGGIASRLAGSPMGLRYAWRQAALASTGADRRWGADDLPCSSACWATRR